MTAMGPSHGSDFRSVARDSEPVVDGSADAAPLDRRIAGPLMAGDQEDDAFAVNDRLLQRPVDRLPGAIEVVTVEIDDPVGADVA